MVHPAAARRSTSRCASASPGTPLPSGTVNSDCGAGSRRGRAWLRASAPEFRRASVDARLGQLTQAWSKSGFALLEDTQVHAWRRELELLDDALATAERCSPSASTWTVLLEYEIPRRERRVDVVI